MNLGFPQKRLSVSTLILAGGQSRRMGLDKALLEIHGQPMLQYLCMIAQQSTDVVYVVTPWSDRYRSLLPSDCIIIPEPPIAQNSRSDGPLMGFWRGLVHVETDWCLVLACDLPNLTVSVLQQWREDLPQISESVIALLPSHEKGWEPLCGFYRPRCVKSLQPFVKKGGRSFQRWLKQEQVATLALENPHFIFNCNTLEDLAQISPNSSPQDFILQ